MPIKLLMVSDSGVPTGFGRVMDATGIRLHKRGYEIHAASFAYDGLLPPMYNGERLPYFVASLQGKAAWAAEVGKLWGALQIDIVLVIQDAPYAEQIYYQAGIDWSRTGFVIMTPVDGIPIFPNWVQMMKTADAGLTISQFGVDAFKEAGVSVGLCRPGVNVDEFFALDADTRKGLRARMGIEPEAFVLGTMAQNQGRKAIPLMIRAFMEFAKDKPNARYFMDMEPTSPAGWDIYSLCKQQGWDESKLIFRGAAFKVGVTELRERYNLLDAHTVMAHREGYGLPLAEAMACGVVSIAMDYCSGPEIVGGERGILIPTAGYGVPGMWGGAEDRFPDLDVMVEKLQWLHDNPEERAAMAKRGMKWARRQTWDKSTDNVDKILQSVAEKHRKMQAALPQQAQPVIAPPPVIQAQPDGLGTVELVEAKV